MPGSMNLPLEERGRKSSSAVGPATALALEGRGQYPAYGGVCPFFEDLLANCPFPCHSPLDLNARREYACLLFESVAIATGYRE